MDASERQYEGGGLVLGRRVGESIMIGDDIEIVLVDVPCMTRARILVRAPRNVAVFRREIWERMKEELEQ